MNDRAFPDEVDSPYRPVGGLGPWAEVPLDEGAWGLALGRLDDLRQAAPAWSDMVDRGARLAAAHQSGALDAAHGGNRDVALALLSGVASLADVDADARAHVRANEQALRMAAGTSAISEDWIRRAHEVACGPQPTHRAWVEGRAQDHLLAHGEYKHHPNHEPSTAGPWQAHSPVAEVGAEVRSLVVTLGSQDFSRLHPVARAAYALHALTHVGPFADGNGRVARVLASAFLLRAEAVPLLVFADDARAYDDALIAADAGDVTGLVDLVARRSADLAGLVMDLHGVAPGSQDDAFDRWRREVHAARALDHLLPAAAEGALERHRARTDLGWLSPLTHARVVPPAPSSHDERFDAPPLVIGVPLPGGRAVEEVFPIDPHPLEGGGVVLRAEEAHVRIEVGLDVPRPAVSGLLEPWLDRVVSTLALRVAAELE